MHIHLAPGFVYVFASKSVPDALKIGCAQSLDASQFILNVANPDLHLQACHFFLNATTATDHMQGAFAAHQTAPECFTLSCEVAEQELKALKTSRQDELDAFGLICRKIADMGELLPLTDDSAAVRDGTGLSAILDYVPSAATGDAVRELLVLYLKNRDARAQSYLASCGLIPYATDELVLLDKSEDSALAVVFEGTALQDTWRSYLADFSGFNVSARSVPLSTWLDFTQAGSDIVDRVSPLCQPQT